MAVEVCEIWWLFFFPPFMLQSNFNCRITVRVPLALPETRHSECEVVTTGSFFLHRGAGKALLRFTGSITLALYFSWMSSSSQCSECDCAMSTPRCHDYTLRLMRQTASASRTAPRRPPCQSRSFWGAVSQRAGQCSFSGSKSTWALCPCPHIKLPPPNPQHRAIRFPWQLLLLRQPLSQRLDLGPEC